MLSKPYYLLFTVLLLASCSDQCESPEISNLKIIPEDNVLRFSVKYDLSQSSKTTIRVWPTGDVQDYVDYDIGTDSLVRTTIYGLKESLNYSLQVLNSCGSAISDEIAFQTNELPEMIKDYELVKNTGAFRGYVVFHQAVSGSDHVYVIVDENAEPVWYEYFPEKLSTFSITPQKTLVIILEDNEIVEYDLQGNLVWQIQKGDKGFDNTIHHEIRMSPDNLIYGLTRVKQMISSEVSDKTGIDSLISDGIVVFDKDKGKIWEWSVLDDSIPNLSNLNQQKARDWGHANSVFLGPDQNFIMSLKNFSQIWSIDYQSKATQWKLGVQGTVSLNDNEYFFQQHAAYYNQNNQLILFDNGHPREGITRGLIFDVTQNGGQTPDFKLADEFKLPKRLYSFKRGNSFQISDDLMLMNSSLTNSIAVIDSRDSVVWEIQLPMSTYRAEYLEAIH